MSVNEFHIDDRSAPFSTERTLWLWGRNHATGEYMSVYFVDSALTIEVLQPPAEGTLFDGGRPFLTYSGALHAHVLDVTAAIVEWHHKQVGDSPTDAEVRLLRERISYLEDQLDGERVRSHALLKMVTEGVLEKVVPKHADT
jgi:hypothetical protein